jgi:HTH-type transcriptional regulator / antitoxin HigA
MSDLRAIRTEADYDWALAEVEPYFDDEPEPGTAEAERFDILSSLIENYEAKRWPIDPPDPVEAILQVMEMTGHTRRELAEVLGSQSRATEVLKRKRRLTLAMVNRLHEEWHIPAEILIKPYHLESDDQGRKLT